MDFTLTQEDYEALISLARRGTTNQEQQRALDTFLQDIEKRNGVKRYSLWIQWTEAEQPLPPNTDFPRKWPPDLRYQLELISRPIAKTDVDEVLRVRARKPIGVLVTEDPAAVVGWVKLEDFF